MSSKIFNALLEEQIDNFINSFKNTSRVVFFDDEKHRRVPSGDFGMYREKIAKDFLKFFTPQKFEMGTGFIISPSDEISTQCDIVIYDSNITPLIQSNERQTFYPVETVIGIGEIKSVMSKSELNDAINKLAQVKKIKSNLKNAHFVNKREYPYNPKEILWDSIFTFIICEKLDFKLDNIEKDLTSMYDKSVDPWNQHNLILSIEDGLLLYNLPQGDEMLAFYSPIMKGQNSHRFEKTKTDNYHHFKLFAMSFFDGISQATVLFPEMVHYMKGFEAVDKLL
jgi:hypothetical protein